MKKIAVIVFHSNIYAIYKSKWINDCVRSIKNQTYKQFDVFEFNYGNDSNVRLFKKENFYYMPLPSYAFAENIAIDTAYKAGYDYFFIVNLDDIYMRNRLQKQIDALNEGYDIVSSDFIRFYENKEPDMLFKMHKYDFKEQADNNHNIIAHPVVAFNRNFWEQCKYFDVNATPQEDFAMWKKADKLNMKFYIVPEVLFKHRVHNNNISNTKPE